MRTAIPIVVLISIICIRCNVPDAVDDPALVSNLRFSPSAFDSFKRNTELRYSLKSPCFVTVYIMKKDSSQNESLVKTLLENAAETKGAHSITWLGETNQRYFAPVGIYFGIVKIQKRRFETNVQVFHF